LAAPNLTLKRGANNHCAYGANYGGLAAFGADAQAKKKPRSSWA